MSTRAQCVGRPSLPWICGIFVGLAALPHSSYGFEWFRLTSIPTLDALLAAALSQWTFAGARGPGCARGGVQLLTRELRKTQTYSVGVL